MQTTIQLAEPVKFQGGKMSSSAYDTAWTARVTNESGDPLFPECIQWLLANQHPDGSWGSRIVNYHDRIINTWSARMAHKERGQRYESQIQRGETYVWETIQNLEQEKVKLVGSELLFPSLMEQAEALGLDLPYHINVYQKEYHKKLSKIDETLWYSPLTTLSHSLEFLGDAVDIDHLSNTVLPYGCVGNSPAATAFYLKYRRDPKVFMFLKKILEIMGDGSVMTVYPIEIFEYGWILYNLMLAGMYFEIYTEICDFLHTYFMPSGVGMSVGYPVPDFDDTMIWCKILYEMHYPVDFGILDAYDAGDYYLTYMSELDPSVGTNIQVLDFLRSCPEFPERELVTEKLLHYLKAEMHPPGFWVDKWHISPYYATSHAVFALCEVDPCLAEKAISWVLKSQNENGLWGENGGTLEETACAVQALMYYHQHVERIGMEIISEAVSTLNLASFTLSPSDLPDLWMGKVLYTPVRITLSSIASAQFMARMGKLQMSSQVYPVPEYE
jgi:halimadienyl-diphosphate synthase